MGNEIQGPTGSYTTTEKRDHARLLVRHHRLKFGSSESALIETPSSRPEYVWDSVPGLRAEGRGG